MEKAQPLDAEVLTPSGYLKMGDIKVGDEVFAYNGEIVKVRKVFPQGKKEIYRIILSDGTQTECCGDHLWATRTVGEMGHRKYGFIARSIKEIYQDLLKNNRYWKHSIPTVQRIDFSNTPEFLIEPYLMGVMLGDGCFTMGMYFTSADPFIVNKVEELIPVGYSVSKYERK